MPSGRSISSNPVAYFVVADCLGKEIPEGAKVDNVRACGDYLPQSHQMSPDCECKTCRNFAWETL